MTVPVDTPSEPAPAAADDKSTAAEHPNRVRRGWVWLVVHIVVYLPLRFWCRTEIVGREHLKLDCGGLVVCNHQSFLDPLFLAVRLTRPVSYLARDSLFKVPFVGWICRNTHVIPISRTAFRGGSIRKAVERLQAGFLVGIFPEGTRSSGAPKDFRPGFLSLVRRNDRPIYPAAIIGADRIMPRGAWFIRPGKVTVVYGPPLSPDERLELAESRDDRAAAAFMQQKVAALYAAHSSR